ncbi:MAG: PilN domain-containing protein [Granulicella sp.]
MRITLNLATRPFVELRPLFARLRLAMGGLIVLAILLGIGLHVFKARASDTQIRMEALKTRTATFEDERRSNEARMRQPQNMAVLERSQFLNELFAKKSFSWTAVMMDLETVLPVGVQVTSIDPSITPEGEVQIRLRVSGDRDRAVQLVRNLETSRRFLAPHLSNESAQTQESGSGLAGGPRGVPTAVAQSSVVPGGVEFDILSGYNPLPAAPLKSAPRTTPARDGIKTHKKVATKPSAMLSAPTKVGSAR